MNASSRLVSQSEEINTPALFVDFGSVSADLTIYDGKPIVTGTVPGGEQLYPNNFPKTRSQRKNSNNYKKQIWPWCVSKKAKKSPSSQASTHLTNQRN